MEYEMVQSGRESPVFASLGSFDGKPPTILSSTEYAALAESQHGKPWEATCFRVVICGIRPSHFVGFEFQAGTSFCKCYATKDSITKSFGSKSREPQRIVGPVIWFRNPVVVESFLKQFKIIINVPYIDQQTKFSEEEVVSALDATIKVTNDGQDPFQTLFVMSSSVSADRDRWRDYDEDYQCLVQCSDTVMVFPRDATMTTPNQFGSFESRSVESVRDKPRRLTSPVSSIPRYLATIDE